MKKVLMTATVASMIDLFNMDNIHILKNLGYEVHVACNFESGNVTSQERLAEFQQELKADNVFYMNLPFPRKLTDIRDIVSTYRTLKNLCAKENFDVIHTQTPIGGGITRFAARRFQKMGTKVIYVAHGFHFFKGAPKKNWLLFYPAEKLFARYTDVLVTINQEDYALAKNKMKARKISYIHGAGVPLKKYQIAGNRQEKRRELGIAEDAFVLIHVAEFSKNKNQETIIHAMEHLKDQNIVYVMCGIGEEKQRLEKYTAEHGLTKTVIFAGYRKDIAEMLNMADCFIFSSFREGLSVAMMEAMAAGLPVICSAVRGNVDLIDADGGRLAAPDRADEFQNAIEEMYQCAINEPEQFAKMGQYNQKKVQQFDSAVVNEEMKKIYMEL